MTAALPLPVEHLRGIAVARGCRHYTDSASPDLAQDVPTLPHELLGCALLAGELNEETFQNIRIASMVLSDLGNDPAAIAKYAARFGVTSRVAHIAHLALHHDSPHKTYWLYLLSLLPPNTEDPELHALPGLSRFTLETYRAGKLSRTWLRTQHQQS